MSTGQEITTSLDEFIADKDMPYWMATLDDGTVVYEDDDRPGLDESSAWLRLKRYCDSTGRNVKSMEIVFRSNRIKIDTSDCDGVFFIKSLLGFTRLKKGDKPLPEKRFKSRTYYNIGKVKNGILTVDKYEMPTVQYRTTVDRPIGELEEKLTIHAGVQV